MLVIRYLASSEIYMAFSPKLPLKFQQLRPHPPRNTHTKENEESIGRISASKNPYSLAIQICPIWEKMCHATKFYSTLKFGQLVISELKFRSGLGYPNLMTSLASEKFRHSYIEELGFSIISA